MEFESYQDHTVLEVTSPGGASARDDFSSSASGSVDAVLNMKREDTTGYAAYLAQMKTEAKNLGDKE